MAGRRRLRSITRFSLMKRLTLSQGCVSIVAAALSFLQLQPLELTAILAIGTSVWCGLAAWRDYMAHTSSMLDPKLLSISVDHHLCRALVAGATVMLLSWDLLRGPEQRRRSVALVAAVMQVLATLCVTSMFVARNALDDIVGSHAESDVEGSSDERSPCSNELEQVRRSSSHRSKTLPRGWRQNAPHRQHWMPPCVPMLLRSRNWTDPNLSTLEEELSPCFFSPYDSNCENGVASHSPSSPVSNACTNSDFEQNRLLRASRSLSFGSSRANYFHDCELASSVSDQLSSSCGKGGSRRFSPARMTLQDLRASLTDNMLSLTSVKNAVPAEATPQSRCEDIAPDFRP